MFSRTKERFTSGTDDTFMLDTDLGIDDGIRKGLTVSSAMMFMKNMFDTKRKIIKKAESFRIYTLLAY
jgi:hypothetical protein